MLCMGRFIWASQVSWVCCSSSELTVWNVSIWSSLQYHKSVYCLVCLGAPPYQKHKNSFSVDTSIYTVYMCHVPLLSLCLGPYILLPNSQPGKQVFPLGATGLALGLLPNTAAFLQTGPWLTDARFCRSFLNSLAMSLSELGFLHITTWTWDIYQ